MYAVPDSCKSLTSRVRLIHIHQNIACCKIAMINLKNCGNLCLACLEQVYNRSCLTHAGDNTCRKMTTEDN